MYKKINSMLDLVNRGLNTHAFMICSSFTQAVDAMVKYGLCTVRTDHADNTHDLPFYVVDFVKMSTYQISKIIDDCLRGGYKMIISNGVKYDSIQEYNMVVKLQSNGDFEFEASDLNIPLRHMYRHPEKLLSCSGNISDPIQEWIAYGNSPLNKVNIRRDLQDLYCFELFNCTLEITKYPVRVGMRNEKFVFWQII